MDSLYYQQVIINSVKYRSEASPVITVESGKRGDSVVLSVTDNGVGILPSEIGRIFDKGFVGSNGRAGKGATGIGLICAGSFASGWGLPWMRCLSRGNLQRSA